MVQRNPHLEKLHAPYLFPEIHRRKQALLDQNPQAQIISLGIGDTTEPIPSCIAEGLSSAAAALGSRESYSGYGPPQGIFALRKKIAEKIYASVISPDELFISDGAKCDIGRLQILFGSDVSMALQDPTYPVYLFTGVSMGQTGCYNPATEKYENAAYLSCTPENGFFPNLEAAQGCDLLHFCSPNNPTGAVPSRNQLQQLVDWAKANKAIILFDAAYAGYIRDKALPRSIYEIDGAREVAIELGSFSKLAGFTGVRLGWTVVPQELRYRDDNGNSSSIHKDWQAIMSTFFNGASNISQMGGIAALSDEGISMTTQMTSFYLDNAKILSDALQTLGYEVYGGTNAPYLWVAFPGQKSWDVFDYLLQQTHILVTPGAGFGPAGEGFIRISAFGHRHDIEEAAQRLTQKLRISS